MEVKHWLDLGFRESGTQFYYCRIFYNCFFIFMVIFCILVESISQKLLHLGRVCICGCCLCVRRSGCGAWTRQLHVLCLMRRRQCRVSRSLVRWCCFLRRETDTLHSRSARLDRSKMHSTRECGDPERFMDSKQLGCPVIATKLLYILLQPLMIMKLSHTDAELP